MDSTPPANSSNGVQALNLQKMSSLLERRYFRSITPGILAGFAATLVETPHFIATIHRIPTLWWPAFLSIIVTLSCFCVVGVFLGLVFEATFHFILGTQPPSTLRDISDQSRTQRRRVAVHALTGVLSLTVLAQMLVSIRPYTADLFSNQFASTLVLVVITVIPMCFAHIGLTRLWDRMTRRLRRLRRIATAISLAIFAISWLSVYKLSGGVPQVLRAVLSLESLLFVFTLVWLYPKRFLHLSALLTMCIILPTGLLTAAFGLPQNTRVLLLRSYGAVENLILLLPSFRHHDKLTNLRQAISTATTACSLPSQSRVRRVELKPFSAIDGTTSRPDVILISIDSLRRDRLDCFGSNYHLSPNLDKFANGASVYLNAFSTSPSTISSMTQSLSGALEHDLPHLSLSPGNEMIVSPTVRNVADIMRTAGYETHAMVGFPLLSLSPFLGQGFTTFDQVGADGRILSSKAIFAKILDIQNRQQNSSHLFWCHIMDVHSWQRTALKEPLLSSSVYDASISRLDHELGLFFYQLSLTEKGRNALVIVTSDHGESLGEQGLAYHGFMSPATLHVPLLIRFPDLGPQRIITAVSHLDLTPTILKTASVVTSGYPGQDLRTLLATPTNYSRITLHEKMLVTGSARIVEVGITSLPWQLIYNQRYNTLMFFNLLEDPNGEVNLADLNLPEESHLLQILADSLVPN
jgi:glucan phosphoethanolaminetransferase (alkaline phosphatase superfamily)